MDDRSPHLRMGPAAAQELARRIARAGTRLVRVEGHRHPVRPEDGFVWRVVERGPDGGEQPTLGDDGSEFVNDTWWCPPFCSGGGG